MEIIYLLIPVVLTLVAILIWVFLWAVKSDQFEDLEGPAHRIIMDDDSIRPPKEKNQEKDQEKDSE